MAPVALKTLAPVALLILSSRLDYTDPNVLKVIQLVFLVSITTVRSRTARCYFRRFLRRVHVNSAHCAPRAPHACAP